MSSLLLVHFYNKTPIPLLFYNLPLISPLWKKCVAFMFSRNMGKDHLICNVKRLFIHVCSADNELFFFSCIFCSCNGFFKTSAHHHIRRCFEIRIPCQHDIQSLWQGFSNRNKCFSSHNHSMSFGCFLEVLEIFRKMPWNLSFVSNHTVFVQCSDKNKVH